MRGRSVGQLSALVGRTAGVVLVTMWAVLFRASPRLHVPPDRLAAAAVVVAGDHSCAQRLAGDRA